jgi:5-(carboxyamino)imidazole ribonucleotide synthase
LHELAALCAAVTTEFENVPAAALRTLAAPCAVSPRRRSGCQLRRTAAQEKAHFVRCGVPCAPHARDRNCWRNAAPVPDDACCPVF